MKRWARRLLPARVIAWIDRRFGLPRRQRWITTRPNAGANPVTDFDLVGLITTWSEQDVVGANVANLLRQGCNRVLVIDNDSPDRSVAEAVGAGAVLARTFATDGHDEVRRIEIVNEVMADQSPASDQRHVWWLLVDADEFPHGPAGRTVRAHLTALDPDFRVVGSRTFHHFPGSPPHYLRGFHPAEFQPLCREQFGVACRRGHWKHPLVRQDRNQPLVLTDQGFHTAVAPDQLVEPREPIFVHHFRYREESVTRARAAAVEPRAAGSGLSMAIRGTVLDAVYSGRWDELAALERSTGPGPSPWSSQVPDADQSFALWYSPESLQAARAAHRG